MRSFVNRTISTIVGIVFAMAFLGLVVSYVPQVLNKAETGVEIISVQAMTSSQTLIVSWETGVPTDGVLNYRSAAGEGYRRDAEFKKTHRLEAEGLSGFVDYYVESCDVVGKCTRSKQYNVTV